MMTLTAPALACPCGAPGPDRRTLARHLHTAHAVPLPQGLDLAQRILDGQPLTPADRTWFAAPPPLDDSPAPALPDDAALSRASGTLPPRPATIARDPTSRPGGNGIAPPGGARKPTAPGKRSAPARMTTPPPPPAPRRCTTCGERGHVKSACPAPPVAGRHCSYCKRRQPDHASACPRGPKAPVAGGTLAGALAHLDGALATAEREAQAATALVTKLRAARAALGTSVTPGRG